MTRTLVLSLIGLILSSAVSFAAPRSACDIAIEKALRRELGGRVTTRGENGLPLRGFEAAAYEEDAPLRVSLVLETRSERYYYFEDCDICADLYRCSQDKIEVSSVKSGHQLGCEDLPQVDRSTVVYDACAQR